MVDVFFLIFSSIKRSKRISSSILNSPFNHCLDEWKCSIIVTIEGILTDAEISPWAPPSGHVRATKICCSFKFKPILQSSTPPRSSREQEPSYMFSPRVGALRPSWAIYIHPFSCRRFLHTQSLQVVNEIKHPCTQASAPFIVHPPIFLSKFLLFICMVFAFAQYFLHFYVTYYLWFQENQNLMRFLKYKWWVISIKDLDISERSQKLRLQLLMLLPLS